MSDQSNSSDKPMSPLERVKARQAEQARHRAAKNKTPDPTDGGKTPGSPGGGSTPKPVRSSANKSGG